jgi:hypothetical protein
VPFEELLRYTIPGYIAFTPLLVLYLLFVIPSPSGEGLFAAFLGILILVGPAAGFILQQMHMLRHERSGYADPKRRTLALIIRKFREEETEWSDKPIMGSEALLAWDFFFHTDKIHPDVRAHILRTWYFIHSFRGTSWAFGTGFVILVAGAFAAMTLGQPLVQNAPVFAAVLIAAVVYLFAVIFLQVKSHVTEQFLWPYEELAVIEYWPHLKELMLRILQSRGKYITCYSGAKKAA